MVTIQLPIKVVIDTNILVGACLGSYQANQIIAHCLSGQLQPVIGASLLAEYEDVLSREVIFVKGKLNLQERYEVLDAVLSVAFWQRIYFIWRPNLIDEGDNHLIDLAIASQANYLITYNLKDFRQSDLHFDSLTVCLPDTILEYLS